MTECAHTGHLQSLMYLCIDLVTCVESINFISTLLASKRNIRSICLDFFSHREWKGPVLESQVFAPLSHIIQPWSTAPCVLTDCRQISLHCLSLCFSRYCSASGRDTDLSALIYQAPSYHYSQSTHSHDTVVTELGGGGWEGGRVGRTETKMMNAVSFMRCISAEHEIFSLYTSVQCHFLLPASARKEFLISLWFLLHEWLMCSTKDM